MRFQDSTRDSSERTYLLCILCCGCSFFALIYQGSFRHCTVSSVCQTSAVLKCNKFALCVFKTALEIRLNELINMHTTCSGCSSFALVFTKGVLGTVQYYKILMVCTWWPPSSLEKNTEEEKGARSALDAKPKTSAHLIYRWEAPNAFYTKLIKGTLK